MGVFWIYKAMCDNDQHSPSGDYMVFAKVQGTRFSLPEIYEEAAP